MTDAAPDETLEALRALAAELRGRLGNLTRRQSDDIGMWLLKALWLGQGEPLAQVFKPVEYQRRPTLRLIVGREESI